MALAVAICRCSPKLSLRSNCTPRYLILVFHSTSCSSRTILWYWKDLLSVTSKASIFSGTILRLLLSKQLSAHHRHSLILTFRILMSSAPYTTSSLSAKPVILVPAGRCMRGKSSYMTFQTSGPTRGPWGAPNVISSLRPFVALAYHPPVAQIVIYHSQKVVWNLFLAALRGIHGVAQPTGCCTDASNPWLACACDEASSSRMLRLPFASWTAQLLLRTQHRKPNQTRQWAWFLRGVLKDFLC